MAAILALIMALRLGAGDTIALYFAGCKVITRPMGPDTVAVKWVCDR
jgi:hypothetical protein